jgi:hypothetical protein
MRPGSVVQSPGGVGVGLRSPSARADRGVPSGAAVPRRLDELRNLASRQPGTRGAIPSIARALSQRIASALKRRRQIANLVRYDR